MWNHHVSTRKRSSSHRFLEAMIVFSYHLESKDADCDTARSFTDATRFLDKSLGRRRGCHHEGTPAAHTGTHEELRESVLHFEV